MNDTDELYAEYMRQASDPAVKDFFTRLVATMKHNGCWGCGAGIYRIDHNARTFTLIHNGKNHEMGLLNEHVIPIVTGYKVVK